MKKILTLALLVGIALFASSCKKEVTQVIQPNQTVIKTVVANDWKLDPNSDGKTWLVTLNVPQLDDYIQENGAVLLYADFDDVGVYEQVPEVYRGISYSYSHIPGAIEVAAETSDFNGTITKPGTVRFKVVLVDSVY